jgi:site-specific DNA-methyltransferase (adenine-specific)
MLQVICTDAMELLESLSEVRVGFADPPDNIGLKYATYSDKLRGFDYIFWLDQIIKLMVQKCNVVWFSYNAKHTFQVGRLVANLLDSDRTLEAKNCVQIFTFGQHNQHDLGNNHRPLIRINRVGETWYTDAIRIPSWRQQHGDPRGDPRGRVPGDVFDFPRVTGNSKQRRAWHPTQLNEGLVERCLRMSAIPGQTVCDPFAGTGTTLRVCKQLGLDCITSDVDRQYCENIAREWGLEKATSNFWPNGRWLGEHGVGIATPFDIRKQFEEK